MAARNVQVSTTRRLVEGELPLPILTDRLIIRSFRASDLETYHTLLTQPEAMEEKNISPNLNYTQEILNIHLPPYSSDVYLAILLKKSDGSEGDLIGDGGIYHLRTEGEWPSLSYRFKSKYWNKGYATEFASAFMQFWWSLPHEITSLQVRANSVNLQQNSPSPKEVAERVYAEVKIDNEASQKVLEKAGFELFDVNMGDEGITHWRHIFSKK